MKLLHKMLLSCTIGLCVAIFTAKTVAAPNDLYRGINCMNVYEDAKKVMDVRQVGATLPEMMHAVGDWHVGQYLVQQAFKRSQYDTQSYKDRASKEFAEREYSRCLIANNR